MQILHVADLLSEQDHEDPSHDFEPPAELVAPRSEKRAIDVIRQAAQTLDPDEILVRAIIRSHRAPSDELAQRIARAMADLVATGGTAWTHFTIRPPTVDQLAAGAAKRLRRRSDDAELREHAATLLERVATTARYVEHDEPGRLTMRRARPDLDAWIGTSGEDDPPRLPVNVPLSPHPVRTCFVEVGEHRLRVRCAVAGSFTPDSKLILLLHGHASKIEEYDHFVAALLERGDYGVIVPDLPGCGYTQRIDHEDVAPLDAPGVPMLRFLEQFVEGVVHCITAQLDLPMRVACVAGGSLGGNLALRLAEARVSWADRIAAWSPASVWSTLNGDLIKGLAIRHTRQRMAADELEPSRREYFREVFADTICATGRTQPEMWYRDGWPRRPQYINRAIWDRREIYCPNYRRWHWRVAYEQLVFSHISGNGAPAPWQAIDRPVLLLAGEHDNFTWTHIYERTRDLGALLAARNVPGKCLLLRDTGHSIHDERPRSLARALDEFLRA